MAIANNGLSPAQIAAIKLTTTGKAQYWVEQYVGDPTPDAWNRLILYDKNGTSIMFPGIAHVSGDGSYELSFQKTSGNNLAPIVNKGRKPTKLVCRLELTGEDQYSQWCDILATFDLLSVTGPQGPYAISHPCANEAGITSVIIERISFPERNALIPYSPVIEMWEYGKPAAVVTQNPTVAEGGIDITMPPGPGTIGSKAAP